MSGERIVVVGDALLDVELEGRVGRVCPESPAPVLDQEHVRDRPGGAGLAAALAAADGGPVTLVTALGSDEAGERLRRQLEAAGVTVVGCGDVAATVEKVRVRADGQTVVRIDRGGGTRVPDRLPGVAVEALEGAGAVLVADYGQGVAGAPALRRALAERARRNATVWDPHPRGATPVHGAWLVTPNEQEAATLLGEVAGPADTGLAKATRWARDLRDRWGSRAVAVTLGARGALLVSGDGPPLVAPAPALSATTDTCGAGDRLAVGATRALAEGAVLSEALLAGVRDAAGFVAAGGAAAFTTGSSARRPGGGPARSPAPVPGATDDLVARVRAGGGTVVATGGCFDLLHVGHVALLERARRLGDCLVVCLNGDDSVRALKGPDRPVVPAEQRRRVLEALACVDAVVVFDEPTPVATLQRLRPDVFVKGGDYAGAHIPEEATLRTWGGQAVVLPYLEGHSSSGLAARLQHPTA